MESMIDGNGFFTPRYYQNAHDKIESKQAMEPISIVHGGGPIIGFNIIDRTKNYFSLTGDNNPNISPGRLEAKVAGILKTPQANTISINNISGKVVNAHFTPSGLLSIDPETLDFPSIPIDWEHVDDNPMVVVLKAKFIHNNLTPITQLPSIDVFEVVKIDRAQDNINLSAAELLTLNYESLKTRLSNNNCYIDEDTEVLIGIYQIGSTNFDKNGKYKEFYKALREYWIEDNNLLITPPPIPLVFYNKEWPIKIDISFTDKLKIISQIKSLEEDINNLNQPINGDKILDGAIGINHLKPTLVNHLINYEYVIEDETQLRALNNKDVSSVIIKKGEYYLSEPILLSPNVKLLVMEPGASILFTCDVGFYKQQLEYDTSYIGLNVGIFYNPNDLIEASVYKNLVGMRNCKGTVYRYNTLTSMPQNQRLVKVYNGCANLTECLSYIEANVSTSCIVDAFYGCNDLINCRDISDKSKILIPTPMNSVTEQCSRISGGYYLELHNCMGVSKIIYKTHTTSYASMTPNAVYYLANTANGGFNLMIS